MYELVHKCSSYVRMSSKSRCRQKQQQQVKRVRPANQVRCTVHLEYFYPLRGSVGRDKTPTNIFICTNKRSVSLTSKQTHRQAANIATPATAHGAPNRRGKHNNAQLRRHQTTAENLLSLFTPHTVLGPLCTFEPLRPGRRCIRLRISPGLSPPPSHQF